MSVFDLEAKAAVAHDTPPAGSHQGVLVAVVDLGTHPEDYKGKVRDVHKIYLRLLFEKWRGKPYADGEKFNPAKALGHKCLVSVGHDVKGDRTYARLDGVSAVPKGMTVPDPKYKAFVYEIGPDAPIPAEKWLPFSFGEPLADIVKASKEWAKFSGQPVPAKPPRQASSPGPMDSVPVGEEEPGLSSIPF